MVRDIDWQQVAFVGFSLANDYWTKLPAVLRLPEVQYWNGERDFRRRRLQGPDLRHEGGPLR